MADDQREPGTMPPTDPAESTEPQAMLPAPAAEAAAPPDAPPDEQITAPIPMVVPGEGPVASPDPQADVPAPATDSAAPPALPASMFAPVTAPPAAPVAGPEAPPVEGSADDEPATGRRALTFFREFVETILLTLVIFVAVRTLVVNFRVDGESMRPTLMNGEYLLVNRATYFHLDLNALRNTLPGPDRRDRDVVYLFGPPERGDIIVFEPPLASDKPFVKRVIGLPGDTIAIRQDHLVYVNGQPLEEHYIAAPPQNLYPLAGGVYTVPPGMIFVMGDNRNNSQDSRSFSAVSLDSVIGKAVVSYWPLDVFGFIPHERYAGAGGDP